jgi:hypothetical protein
MERTIYQFDHLARIAEGVTRAPSSVQPVQQGGQAVRVGVILNRRSHQNNAERRECEDRSNVSVVCPETRLDIARELARFADRGIDLLIISGGDGTVRDVLTMGQPVFGSRWPKIAVLPKGKTNALNVDLGSPSDWTLAQAIDAYSTGRTVERRPLAIRRAGTNDPAMLGFIFGAGAFSLGVEAGQDAHRIGFFNSLAVGITSAWGIMQALFGSDANRWRRGTRMDLAYLPSGETMPHSRHGDPSRRHVILASTLDTMPLDIKLFGKGQDGIRLVVLDHPRRRIMFSIPAILAGWRPRWLPGAGLHHLSAKGFVIDLDAPFILDGEHFAPGRYSIDQGPELTFVTG